MWRLTPIEAGPSDKDLQAIAEKLHPNERDIPNFLRLLAKSRAATVAYVQAEEALANGELTPYQREQIALAVAEIDGSAYCLAVHEKVAREIGLSDEEIQSARKALANNPKTQAMLHFVQAVVLQRGEVSDADFWAVRQAGFSEVEVVEILANISLNIFANYFNILAWTDLDFPRPRAGQPTSLSSAEVTNNTRRRPRSMQPLSHP